MQVALFFLLFVPSLAHNTGVSVRTQAFLQNEKAVAAANLVRSTEEIDVFPVPTTSRCIVIMICQYMIIYLALAVCRSYHEFSGTPQGNSMKALKAAAQTLTYGPMLCVLFIACRMRVEFLSAGTDQPQLWVQHCMYAVTFSVLASTLLVLFIPFVTGKHLPLKDGVPDRHADTDTDTSPHALYALTAIRYLILIGLYCGLAGIIVGISIYLPPGATDLAKLPPPAPAVHCTMILAVAFFTIQLIIAFCRTYEELNTKKTSAAFPRIVNTMQEAATTVEFGPVLAILFLCARMRALQHDTQPQVWAQDCMYASTGAMITTTLLAIVIPLAVGGKVNIDPKTNEKTVTVPEGTSLALVYTLNALRFACMIGFYGGAFGVIYSIYAFEAPGGPEDTLPVSPTAHCVANLTCQFFFVYGMMTIMLAISSVTGVQLEKWKLFSAVEAAKSTLGFAPMLAILFVTTRMYALLITHKKGAPQAWVQDGMYMATWSLFISFVSCLISGLAMDKVKTDDDGNVINQFSNRYVAIIIAVVRYLSMLLLYGGILLVIIGLFTMTPETANGRGSVPVVTDATNNYTPFGSAPPGPGDAAAAGQGAHDAASGTHNFFF